MYGPWDSADDVPDNLLDLYAHDPILDQYINDFMSPELSEEGRQEILDEMAEYLDWEYDLDLNEIWDWEDFREAYDSA